MIPSTPSSATRYEAGSDASGDHGGANVALDGGDPTKGGGDLRLEGGGHTTLRCKPHPLSPPHHMNLPYADPSDPGMF